MWHVSRYKLHYYYDISLAISYIVTMMYHQTAKTSAVGYIIRHRIYQNSDVSSDTRYILSECDTLLDTNYNHDILYCQLTVISICIRYQLYPKCDILWDTSYIITVIYYRIWQIITVKDDILLDTWYIRGRLHAVILTD